MFPKANTLYGKKLRLNTRLSIRYSPEVTARNPEWNIDAALAILDLTEENHIKDP